MGISPRFTDSRWWRSGIRLGRWDPLVLSERFTYGAGTRPFHRSPHGGSIGRRQARGTRNAISTRQSSRLSSEWRGFCRSKWYRYLPRAAYLSCMGATTYQAGTQTVSVIAALNASNNHIHRPNSTAYRVQGRRRNQSSAFRRVKTKVRVAPQ